jgi:hypothetical protein
LVPPGENGHAVCSGGMGAAAVNEPEAQEPWQTRRRKFLGYTLAIERQRTRLAALRARYEQCRATYEQLRADRLRRSWRMLRSMGREAFGRPEGR